MRWYVVESPSDPEMYAVEGAYLVADLLPIEDAHLIAAAPDLLSALNELRGWINNWSPDFIMGVEWPDADERACAAIAKAKGETK